MKKIIAYIIVLTATIYVAVLYGSAGFLLMFFLEILLPVSLLITMKYLNKYIRVLLDIPIPVVNQGETSSLHVLFENISQIPCGKILVKVEAVYPISGEKEYFWFSGHPNSRISAYEKTETQAEYLAECVGNIQFCIIEAYQYDFLGIFRMKLSESCWKQLDPENLLVLPKLIPVPIEVSRQTRDFAGESDVFSQDRSGDDPAEVFRIREYQQGDKLRSIHWKMSAKIGELMICEQSDPVDCGVVFYLDLGEKAGASKKKRKKKSSKMVQRQNHFLQIVVSISNGMIVERCSHYIVWYDSKKRDICRFMIQKEEDVLEMLMVLGSLCSYEDKLDLQELYRQKYHAQMKVTNLVLDLELKLSAEGLKISQFSSEKKQMEKQLTNLTLTV